MRPISEASFMGRTDKTCHSGIVKSINNQHIVVTVLSQSACVSCHAKGACSSSDSQEKEIEITTWVGEFVPGEKVEIISDKSQGFRAVFLAYILPLILMVSELVIILNYTNKEVLAATGAIFILTIYYIGLFSFRNNLMKSLKFTIRKSSKIEAI